MLTLRFRLAFWCTAVAVRFDAPGYPWQSRVLDRCAGWLVLGFRRHPGARVEP